ncbi:hypothetical protein M758_UG338900 [Ceratodon purpureus]|nr:hypothetical protein M758_UG338900 [Ceratodon purpureus]
MRTFDERDLKIYTIVRSWSHYLWIRVKLLRRKEAP